jgi:hypothetical protein
MPPEMIMARKSQLKFYRDVELYRKAEGGGFVLYKQSGMTLRDMRIDEERHPSPTAQIIGIIDCYEALTNDDRPYRSAMGPFDTLNQIIAEDVENGK